MRMRPKGSPAVPSTGTVSRAFLRWAGSKRQLLPRLRKYWTPSHRRYIEPFMGSACLFFEIQPKRSILGDINSDLVSTFFAIRDHPLAVSRALQKLPTGKSHYYRTRAADASTLSDTQRAARFIYLNRFCFNGLYRTNSNGEFNVPYGSGRTGHLPTYQALNATSRALRNASLRHADFERTVALAKAGDFVYLDPPFAVSNRRIFRQYDPSSFGLSDLQRLADMLPDLDQRGATFLISYALCREAIDAFRSWNIRRVHTQRNISGFAQHRRRAVELLITNASHPKIADN